MSQLYEILGISRKRLSHFYKTINSFPPEPPEELPVGGQDEDREAVRDKKCQLCGDYFTEAELEVHHCN